MYSTIYYNDKCIPTSVKCSGHGWKLSQLHLYFQFSPAAQRSTARCFFMTMSTILYMYMQHKIRVDFFEHSNPRVHCSKHNQEIRLIQDQPDSQMVRLSPSRSEGPSNFILIYSFVIFSSFFTLTISNCTLFSTNRLF